MTICAFIYLEMPKVKKKESELETMFDKWLFVIQNICYLMEQPKELQEQVFTKFFEEAMVEMLNSDERFEYERSRIHFWDDINQIEYAFHEGKEAGIEEGKKAGAEETRKEAIQRMLSKGMNMEDIQKLTG